MKTRHLSLLISIVALILFFTRAFYTVMVGDVAIITQFGKIVGKPKEAGLHLKIPFIQKDHHYSTARLHQWKSDPYQVPILAKNYVEVVPSAMWKIADPIRFFQTIYSVNRANIRLDDIINAAIRAAISHRKRNDIVDINSLEDAKKSVKQEIKNEIINYAKPWLNKFGIEIYSLDIKIIGRTV